MTQALPKTYATALAFVLIAGLAAKAFQVLLALPDPALVFLTGVLFSAVLCGLGPSIVAAVASVLVYNFFFVDPIYTFRVTKPQDVLSLLVFLAVAVLTSNLMARIRDQADAARRREARTKAPYEFSRELAAAAGIHDLLPAIVRHVAEQFQATAIVSLPVGGRPLPRAAHPAGAELDAPEHASVTWVWEHDQAAGEPGGDWLHVPLDTARGAVGVLSLRPSGPETLLELDQRQLLEGLARPGGDRHRAHARRRRAGHHRGERGRPHRAQSDRRHRPPDEIACTILQLDRTAAIGHRFDALGTDHPHYLRLRAAVCDFLAHPEREGDRTEIALFLRGRDHYYVLRPTPFRAADGSPGGVILALQDVTYVRDQEARREHLVATISHELGTPLTSLRMALELLERNGSTIGSEQRGLLETVREDLLRLHDVARRLLDLSRSRATGIALDLDFSAIVALWEHATGASSRDARCRRRSARSSRCSTTSGAPTRRASPPSATGASGWRA